MFHKQYTDCPIISLKFLKSIPQELQKFLINHGLIFQIKFGNFKLRVFSSKSRYIMNMKQQLKKIFNAYTYNCFIVNKILSLMMIV